MKSKENLIGAWGFLIGVVLAVAIGIFQSKLGLHASTLIYSILVILGFFVGLLNVADRDTMTFLFASLSLVIVSGLGQYTLVFISNLSPVLAYLSGTLSALLVMFVPATIIVALKAVFSIAS
jgi:hypothetical protein